MSGEKKNTAGLVGVMMVSVLYLAVLALGGGYVTVKRSANGGSWWRPFGIVSPSDADGSEEQPDKLAVTSTAVISVMGDMMGHMPTVTAAYDPTEKVYNFDNIFTYISPYVSEADYAVANLETTLRGTLGGAKYQGYPCFNTPDSYADALQKAGFDMLLTANNHSYDTGAKGMQRTLEVLDKKNIAHTGTFLNEDEKRYLVEEVNGIKIGMICYTYETDGTDSSRKYLNGLLMTKEAAPLINSFSYQRPNEFYDELSGHIAAMRAEGAEEIMLFIHWGDEYHTAPNAYQKRMAQKIGDLGVDVIVGGHPHVIQPADLLTSSDGTRQIFCIYSLGNAVSNQRADRAAIKTGHTEDGALLNVTFTKYSDGRVIVSDVNLLPTWVDLRTDKQTGRKIYRIVPLDPSVKDWGTAFEMSAATVKKAKASYERTAAITDEGMEQAQSYYRNAAAAILSDSDWAA